ncbi:hypothetical protein PMIN04_006326 [Paraphaeosphaeria minitans]
MPLLLESCTPHDIPSLVALSADAFSAPTPTNVFLDTPAVHAFRIKRLRHTFARDPWAVFTKAVDTALPADAQVVAFAKWTRPHSRALGEEEGAGGYVDLVMSREELPGECARGYLGAGRGQRADGCERHWGEAVLVSPGSSDASCAWRPRVCGEAGQLGDAARRRGGRRVLC